MHAHRPVVDLRAGRARACTRATTTRAPATTTRSALERLPSRSARGGRPLRRLRQRVRGDDGRAPDAEERRPRGGGRRRLRRHLPHLRQGAATVRGRGDVPRHGRPGEGARRDPPVDAPRLGRDAQQSDAQDHRRRRGRGHRGREGGAGGGGQHVRDTGPAATARAGGDARRALDDEISERPLRRGRRRRDDARRRPGRAPPLPAKIRGWCTEPVRLLPRAARSQDAADPDGAARRERPDGGRVARRPPAGVARALPRPAVAPRARRRRAGK